MTSTVPHVATDRCRKCHQPAGGRYCDNCGADQFPQSSKPVGWRGRYAWVTFGFVAVACLLIGLYSGGTLDRFLRGTLDPATVEPLIANDLSTVAGTTVTVECPSGEPMKAGHIFECVASDRTGRYYVRVTENDDQGHIVWQLTTQRAG